MPLYRVTIRHGRPHRYAMADFEAGSLADALRLVAERMTEAVQPDADLAEIRVQADPGTRRYAEG